jgi:hypothetical protein
MKRGWMKWAVWLFFLIVSFAIMEGASIKHDTSTLSRFVWDLTAAFPPIQYIAGFLAGFLCCHFWWLGNPAVDANQPPLDNRAKK